LKHTTPITIRFADTDQLGHVNNAVYLTLFEQARVSYFNDLLTGTIHWDEKGIVIARAEINYLLPIKFEDSISVETCCTAMGTKSIELTYRIFKTSEQAPIEVASGMTVMVCFDYRSQQSIEIPQEWKEQLEQFERLPEAE